MINDTSGETTKVTPSPQTAGSCQKKSSFKSGLRRNAQNTKFSL